MPSCPEAHRTQGPGPGWGMGHRQVWADGNCANTGLSSERGCGGPEGSTQGIVLGCASHGQSR